MSLTIEAPELDAPGLTMSVGLWLVEPGQDVLEGERLVELQIPGLVFMLSSPCNGTLETVLVHAGARIVTGTPLARIRHDEESDRP